MYRVALVCEGPADRAIIEAVLDYYFDDYEARAIQPPLAAIGGDAGPLGGGWKGIRTWCKQESSVGLGVVQGNSDLLIIHVDADVAGDAEIGRARPCPPPGDSADEVRALILSWLGADVLPDNTVLCVPSMASETWALVALWPGDAVVVPCDPAPAEDECVECRSDIKALLRRLGRKLQRKLIVSQDGKLKNQARGYRARKDNLTKGWTKVIEICSEARRFDSDLRAAMLDEL